MPAEPLVRHVVTFGRILREAGLEVGPGRLADALTGLDKVDIARQDDVYWTLRSTIVSHEDEIEPFDRAFNAWFLRSPVVPVRRAADGVEVVELLQQARREGAKARRERGG